MSILTTAKTTGGGKPFFECSHLIYGPPKIGKSTIASEFPDPLFIDMEGGLGMLPNHVSAIEVREEREAVGEGKAKHYRTVGKPGWQQINEIILELGRGGHNYKTLIFDPIATAYQFCSNEIAMRNSVADITDMEYGKGYARTEEEFRFWMYKAHMLPMGVVFISHETSADIGTKGDLKRKVTAELDKRAWKVINGIVDFIFWCKVEGNKRVMYTRGDDEYTAGSRLAALPSKIDMSYEALAKQFEAATNGGDPEKARDGLIAKIMTGEQYLADNKIDKFNIDKRRMASRNDHAGSNDLRTCDFVALEGYLQHLRDKVRESKESENAVTQ